MELTIAQDIKEILMERGTAVIPGLGGLSGTYKAAYIDQLQGQFYPPSFSVSYDPNNTIDDGVLVDFLMSKYRVTLTDAQKLVDDFVAQVHETLDRHELFLLPEVGRLYRDNNKKIQFLHDNVNLNSDAFGLPSVQFYPVSRMRTEPIAANPLVEVTAEPVRPPQTPTVTEPPVLTPVAGANEPLMPQPIDDVPKPAPLLERLPAMLGISKSQFYQAMMLAALFLIAVVIYFMTENSNDKEALRQPQNRSQNAGIANVNTAPNAAANGNLPPDGTDSGNSERNTVADQSFVDKQNQENDVKAQFDVSANGNKAIMVIGGFADRNNIRRLKSWIKQNNYGVYEKKSGGLTVIGAVVEYSSKEELRKIFRRFKSRYGDEVEIRYQ